MCLDFQLRLQMVFYVSFYKVIKKINKQIYLRIGFQVVVKDINRNGEVSSVKGV